MLFTNGICRAARPYVTKTTDLAVPLTQRLQANTTQFYAVKKSDPIEGFGLIGILAGTMFICITPGLYAAMQPKTAEH